MKRKDYISWKEYFMGVAELSSKRSKDPVTQVGCCIVDPSSRHILSIGYNGLPRGFNDDEFSWEKSDDLIKDKNSYVVHAEANAILNADKDLTGSEVYVTLFPCNECAKLLAQKKVKKIIYKDARYLKKDKGKVALEIFKKAGITVQEYKGGKSE
jgi:dCMP deaminase